MSLIGLVSDMAEQRGQLRFDAAPGDSYLGVRRALAASPRLGSSRRVSGDVIRRFNDCLYHAYVSAARDAVSAFACALSLHRVRRSCR